MRDSGGKFAANGCEDGVLNAESALPPVLEWGFG